MQMNFELEQGILEKKNDFTGSGLFQKGDEFEQFFSIGGVDKVYFPMSSDSKVPFEVKFNLSRQAKEFK